MPQQSTNIAPGMRNIIATGRRPNARESDWIGRKLNQVYNQALAEPLPPEFMALIDAIGDRERERSEDPSKS